jgi:hypothetical protein
MDLHESVSGRYQFTEDPELAFVHAAQTRVGANSALPNGWFLLGR